ncbi:MAG: DM13 domain-containing protein [Litorimonas sp.]
MSTLSTLKIAGLTAAALIATACSNDAVKDITPETVVNTETAEKVVAAVTEATPVSIGTFSGRSDHVTNGGVSIVKKDGGYHLMLDDAFFLDGAPDPVVALGNNGEYKVENKLGPLGNTKGAQSYAIPANMNPADFTEAYIWCEKFSVPLGIATLKSASYGS